MSAELLPFRPFLENCLRGIHPRVAKEARYPAISLSMPTLLSLILSPWCDRRVINRAYIKLAKGPQNRSDSSCLRQAALISRRLTSLQFTPVSAVYFNCTVPLLPQPNTSQPRRSRRGSGGFIFTRGSSEVAENDATHCRNPLNTEIAVPAVHWHRSGGSERGAVAARGTVAVARPRPATPFRIKVTVGRSLAFPDNTGILFI